MNGWKTTTTAAIQLLIIAITALGVYLEDPTTPKLIAMVIADLYGIVGFIKGYNTQDTNSPASVMSTPVANAVARAQDIGMPNGLPMMVPPNDKK